MNQPPFIPVKKPVDKSQWKKPQVVTFWKPDPVLIRGAVQRRVRKVGMAITALLVLLTKFNNS